MRLKIYLFLTVFAVLAGRAQGRPAIEVNLASQTAWTFREADSTAPSKPLAVPAGGWRLNGFPTASAGVYERAVTVPKMPGGRPQRTFIAFEAVNWEATVSAGPDASHLKVSGRHLSAWTPFRIDISDAIAPGASGLVRVEVRDRSFFRNSKGQFTVPAGTEWNDRQARGIIRGVSLQVYPDAFIDSVFVKPSTASNTLSAVITLMNRASSARHLALTGLLSPASAGAAWKYPAIPARDVLLAPGETHRITVGPLPWTPGRASWWQPNVPFQPDYHAKLHMLTFTLRDAAAPGGPALQTEAVRFGFCSPGQKGNYYTFNGVRFNLRGDSLPEGTIGTDAFARLPGFLPPAPGSPGWPGAVRNYQRLNFNVIRMHQVPCTRYMMEVCDELGMLVIPETAIRGGGILKEAVDENPDAFRLHLRELVERDRNHPSVFKWSLENELFGAPEPFIRSLYDVCREADGTRPCSIDDNASYPAYPDFAVIEHYSQPAGTPDATGGTRREDRPFGQGEYAWPQGNQPRGPVLFALPARDLRAHDNADIRPYTLIDVWPGVIPGLMPLNFPDPHLPPDSLEQGGRSLLDLRAPWTDPRIRLIQRSFAPVAVFDRDFDHLNTMSNGRGVWPSLSVILPSGKSATRNLEVFNDDLSGDTLTVRIVPTLYLDGEKTQKLSAIQRTVQLAPGSHRALSMIVPVPSVTENRTLLLTLQVLKNGQERFTEPVLCAVTPEKNGSTARFEGEDTTTSGNWPGHYGKQAFLVPVRNGQSGFQLPGLSLQRGVGVLPGGRSPLNPLSRYGGSDDAQTAFAPDAFLNDPRLPVRAPGPAQREPIAFRGTETELVVRADAKDDLPHRLSLYLLDYARSGQSVDVDILDLRGNPLDSRRVDKFGEGRYLQYRVTGSVVVRIVSLTDAEPSLSGLFLDPAE